MNVKMMLNAENVSKEDLRAFIQKIREWELRTPRTIIVGILFDTDPQMSSAEVRDILQGVFPEFKNLEIRGPYNPDEVCDGSLLRLGCRAITVDGELIGTCQELTLSMGAATGEQIKDLQEAESIALVKILEG